MCMRFRNSRAGGVDSSSIRDERSGENLRHFGQTRANTGVFDRGDHVICESVTSPSRLPLALVAGIRPASQHIGNKT